MRILRPLALAVALAPALSYAAGDATASIDAAMRCVRNGMTSAFVPATASVEQLVSVVLVRCSDEVETAAADLAGAPLLPERIEASRNAVRRELYDYALAVAAGPAADPAPAAIAPVVW